MSVNKVNSDGSLLRVAGGTLYADAPIGSYLAMKDNSVNPQGYLLADGRDTTGTDDELSTKYPSLYAYLGSTNILPTELDHSVLGTPEDISTNLNHTTNSSYYTAPYDGVIIINWTASDRYKSVYWSDDGTNWTEFVYNLDTSTYQTTTVPVKKGDRLYLRDSIANSVIYARFYKQYKYIKAKQVVVPSDIAEYIRNQNILSDYEDITLPTTAATAMTMPYDGVYILANYGVSNVHHIYLNGIEISAGTTGNNTTGASTSSTILFKKGDTMYRLNTYTGSTFAEHVAYYKLRDYTGR